MLFVISGPSAVGKNSIVNEILKMDKKISRIVTWTTREIRKSERHGVDYFFIPKNDFLSEIARGNLIEFSEVYGNYYGVTFSAVEEKINSGEDAVLIINWEGFLKIKKAIETNVYGIFILPPSIKDLELRIKFRGEDSSETIERRISMAHKDIAKADLYDFCLKNVNIVATAKSILEKINNVRRRTYS